MGSGFFTIALDQLKYWTIAGRVMADFQTFVRQFRNDFLDRGGFMQLGQFSPSASAVCARRCLPKGQQFLAKLGVEQIKVEVIVMKLANLLGTERNQNLVQLDIIIDILFAFFSFDLIKRRLCDVNLAGAHQFSHLPKKESEQQGANMRTIDVRVRHDDDPTVAQLRDVEAAFVFAVAILFRFADARADRSDHRLNLIVLEKLILARFLDVDKLAANWQDRLITPIASLLG